MKRRDLLSRAGVALLAAPFINRGRFSLFAGSPAKYSSRAIELVGRSLVVDMLGLLTLDWDKLSRWEQIPSTFNEHEFQKLKSSGINVFHPAVDLPGNSPYEDTLAWLRDWNGLLDRHPDHLLKVSSAEDMDLAKAQGKLGILLGMQNCSHFRTAQDVAMFYNLGQRVSQLTYNSQNKLGCGCIETPDTGLTGYGVSIIAEMNRVGMAIDVSHAGDRTTLDAFEASSKPVLITHSNCRALAEHPRCKPDKVLRAMAQKGSVMGITGIRMFVAHHNAPTIEDVLNHFDHVVRMAGVDHAGIGSDTGLDMRDHGKPQYDIPGLNHPQRIFDLTEGLIRRKYSDTSIELILGGNFRRVLSSIQA